MSLDGIDNAYELSSVEQGMLFHILELPHTDVYVTYISMEIIGNLDIDRFKNAWLQTFQKHEALRSAYLWEGLDEPLRIISSTVQLHWTIDFPDSNDAITVEQYLETAIAQERQTQFNLTHAPLSRFRLIKWDNDHWHLVWVVHHLLADGWSTPIILKDIVDHYTTTPSDEYERESILFSYSKYLTWLQERDFDTALRHWSAHLDKALCTPIKLPMPSTASVPQNSHNPPFKDSGRTLSKRRTTRILDFCRENQLSLSSLVHGTWALTLGDYTNNNKPLFGTTVSGRRPEVSGMIEAVGMFLNTIPLQVPISSEMNSLHWLKELQCTLLANSAIDYLPLSSLNDLIDKSNQEAIFESLIAVEGHSSDIGFQSSDQSIRMVDIRYTTHSNYPLALLVFPGEQLRFELIANYHRFEQIHISTMMNRIDEYMDALMDMTSQSLATITDKIGKCEERLRSYLGYTPVHRGYNTIHEWFQAICNRQPDEVAVITQLSRITYGELDNKANRIANFICSDGLHDSQLIGVLLPRGIEQIAAILGILKTGHAYLPLDPSYPKERILGVMADSGVPRILTSEDFSYVLDDTNIKVLHLSGALNFSVSFNNNIIHSTNKLAYVLYTSGSTGRPKGVAVSHSNLLYSTAARIEYYGEDKPVFLLLSSIAFDSSIAGIYWALCTGGSLVLPEPEQEKDIFSIAESISAHRVTHTLCLPTLYFLLLQNTNSELLSSLTHVIVAGEQCASSIPAIHFQTLPSSRLYNEYGPTESCVWASVYELTQSDESPIPIGKPIGTTFMPILDSFKRLCPEGVEGELFIGGCGLSEGYYLQESLTTERFIENPFPMSDNPMLYQTGDLAYRRADGNIVFTGRVDRQLKIRGHRIEPKEIESTILQYPEIGEVVVVSREINRVSNVENSKHGSNSTQQVHSYSDNSMDNLLKNVSSKTIELILDKIEYLTDEQATSAISESVK